MGATKKRSKGEGPKIELFLHDNKTNLWLLGSFSKSFLFYKFSIHFVQLDPHNKEKNSTKPWNTLDTEVQKFCIADKAVLSAPPSSHSLQNENEGKKKRKLKSPVAILTRDVLA